MADVYDAGAIRSRAELDRDPFIEGLRYCLEQGRAFARERFTATVSVNTANARRELEQLRALMGRIGSEDVDVDVNVRGTQAGRIELARIRAEIERTKLAQAAYRAEIERSRVAQATWRTEQERARTETVRARTEQARVTDAIRRRREEEQRAAAGARASTRTNREQAESFGLLRVAIEQLGPPLIPLAGGLLAASSAAAGLGPALLLSIKGAMDEYKRGTDLGQQYAGTIRGLKDALTEVEHTSAAGTIAGLNQATSKALTYLPQFNALMGTSSRYLGDIGSHVVGGLLGGLQTFTPLILQAEQGADRLAARFEQWATGPGGAGFAHTLATDLEHIGPAISNLTTLAVHLVSAFHPVGLGMLDTLSNLAEVLNHIPTGVLTAAATAYIAFRTAVTITSGIDRAIVSLQGLTAAETEAAAASSRAGAAAGAGGLARLGLLGTAVRAGAVWVGAAVAIHAAANATDDWRHSTDLLKGSLANSLDAASKLLSLHPMDAWNTITSSAAANAQARYAKQSAQQQINNIGQGPAQTGVIAAATAAGVRATAAAMAEQRQQMAAARAEWSAASSTMSALTRSQTALAAAGQQGTQVYRDQADQLQQASARAQDAAGRYYRLKTSLDTATAAARSSREALSALNRETNSARDRYAGAQQANLAAANTNAYAQSPTLTSAVGSLQSYARAVASAQKSEESWTKVTDDNTVKIRGNTYETKAWDAALAATNGNRAAAAGLLLGHSQALEQDKAAARDAAAQQQRLSGAIGAAELAYKLSDSTLNAYSASLGITADQLGRGRISAQLFVADIGLVKDTVDNANTATAGWVAALQQFEQGADTAASRGQLLAAAMVSLNGTAISYGAAGAAAAQANQQFVDAFNQADKSVVNLKTGMIDLHNAGSAPLFNALQQLQTQAANFAAITYQNEVSTRGRTQAAKDAAAVYRNDTYNALVGERQQLGLTRQEAQRLADRYFHWPKNAKTQIEAMGVEGTNRLLNGIGEQLALLTHKPWISVLGVNTATAVSKTNALQSLINRMRQGRVPGVDVTTYEGQQKIAALQAQLDRLQSKHLTVSIDTYNSVHGGASGTAKVAALGAFGMPVRAYAGGGLEDHRAAIYQPTPGLVRVFAEPETRGEAFVPLANDYRRPQAKAIAAEVVKRFGGDVRWNETGGFSHVTGTGHAGTSSSSSSTGSRSSGSSSSSSKSAALLRSLQSLDDRIRRTRLATETVRELDKHASSTLLTYASTLVTQVEAANRLHAAPSTLVARVRRDNALLKTEVTARDKILATKQAIDAKVSQDKAAYNQTRNTVMSAVTGGFDIGTSGNGYAAGIASSLHQQVVDSAKFEKLRGQAKALGLNKDYLAQLTAEGPQAAGANLAAIVAGGKSYVSGINADAAKLHDIALRLGTTQANETNGAKLAADLKEQAHQARLLASATAKMNRTLSALKEDLHTIRTDLRTARDRARK